MDTNEVKKSFLLGVPVFISYTPVALTFGLFAKNSGFTLLETFSFSFFILSGSAQFMSVNLLLAGTNIFWIIFTIFLMNFRFFLMSSALSKKLHSRCNKFILPIACLITDESFALASLQETKIKPEFLLTIQCFGYTIWWIFTIIGYTLGDFLPINLSLSLGIGIHALFISMLVPQMKKSKAVTIIILLAGFLNWIIKFLDVLPSGWNIILAILISSFIGSFLIEKEEEQTNE